MKSIIILFCDRLKFQCILQNTVYKLTALVQQILNFDSANLSFSKLENQLRTCIENIIIKIVQSSKDYNSFCMLLFFPFTLHNSQLLGTMKVGQKQLKDVTCLLLCLNFFF